MTAGPATALLLLFAVIAFNAYRRGELGDLLRAKFFNAAEPTPANLGSPFVSGPGMVGGSWTGGSWTRPTSGRVSSPFGQRDGRLHAGTDYAAPIGTDVVAARTGRVTRVGNVGGYGLLVELDHGDGWTTRYAHLNSHSVQLGQRVAQGQRIGLIGQTGNATGPHLHFETRLHGAPQDPEIVMGGLDSPAPSSSSAPPHTSAGAWRAS